MVSYPAYEIRTSFCLKTNFRIGAVGVQMPNGIYMFGGNKSPNTSEFLQNNSTIWQQGPDIPYLYSSLISFGSNFLKRLTMLPMEFDYNAKGHAISKTELILINEDCIIKGHGYDHHNSPSIRIL